MVVVLFAVYLLLQQTGRDPRLRFQNGMAAVRKGDAETVFREASLLLNTTGFESSGHMLRGRWFLETRKYVAAAHEFSMAIDDPDTRIEAITRCGEAFYRMHQFVDAERMLLQALEHDADNSDARRWLASTYYDLGAMSLALEHLGIVGINNPTDGRPSRLRGLIHKDFEQFGEAIPEYQEALRRELIPKERQAVVLELADCLVHQLRFDEALTTLESASDSAEALAIQASCYLALGNTTTAIAKADAALKQNPALRSAILSKAAIFLESDRAEEVVPLLEEAVKTYPNDFEVLFQLIKAWRLTGRTEQADSQAPKLAELEQLIDEFAALNKQTFNDLDNAELRCQLGRLAIKLDRPALAGSWFQAALAINPQHAEARQLLESVQNPGQTIPDRNK